MKAGLIINADDFGLSQDTDAAVLQLARRGSISSVSLMANMPHVEEISQVLEASPRLGVGLHVNLTQGRPLCPAESVPTLVRRDGAFHGPAALAKRALLGKVSLQEIRRELRAQIERVRGLVGERLDHWDSHQGAHRFEPLATVIMSTCKEEGVLGMRSHRHYFATATEPGRVRRAGFGAIRRFGAARFAKEKYYEWMSWRAGRHFVVPDGILTLSGGTTAELLLLLLQNGTPPGILEVPCHPATSTKGLSGTRLLQARVEEFEVLASDAFRQAIAEGSLRLMNFRDLAQVGSTHEQLAASSV